MRRSGSCSNGPCDFMRPISPCGNPGGSWNGIILAGRQLPQQHYRYWDTRKRIRRWMTTTTRIIPIQIKKCHALSSMPPSRPFATTIKIYRFGSNVTKYCTVRIIVMMMMIGIQRRNVCSSIYWIVSSRRNKVINDSRITNCKSWCARPCACCNNSSSSRHHHPTTIPSYKSYKRPVVAIRTITSHHHPGP